MMPFGAGLSTSLAIAKDLDDENKASWIAASYALTQGAFVLIGGRFGDVFGHKNILLGGAVWWVIWSLVSGFAKGIVALSLFRGLTGMGAAFIVPNAVALIGHTFPPGRMRNVAMGLFGAMAPSESFFQGCSFLLRDDADAESLVGAAGGSVISVIFVQLAEWKWEFFF
jgi:MFS family permease